MDAVPNFLTDVVSCVLPYAVQFAADDEESVIVVEALAPSP